MLPYAWKCLTGRSSLWLPALGCAFILTAPGVVIATFLAAPAVSLAVTGDPALALSLLPDGLKGSESILAWAGIALAAAFATTLYARLYSVALWASRAENEPGLGAAWRGSRHRWRTVLWLYLQGYSAFVVGFAALAALVIASAGGTLSISDVFIAGSFALIARSVVRIALTLAVRAAILDDARGRAAWGRALAILRDRRADAVAAWVSLLAAGVAVWMGGRLVSPVLQETSLAYPARSSYTLLREAAQLLLSVPLEAFLMALSMAVWTAVYIGIENRPEPRPAGERRRWWAPADPWVVRALASLVVLVIIANGIPTAVDEAYESSRRDRAAAVESRELSPDELLGIPSAGAASADVRYRVRAALDERALEWTTRIQYRNTSGEDLVSLGVNVFAAAWQRELEDLPLARDLLATDLTGSLESRARPGSLEVRQVTVEGTSAEHELAGTALTIELPRTLPEGAQMSLSIALEATLPEFPERFGVWEGLTLLGNWVPVVASREDGAWRFDEYGQIGDPFVSELADYEVSIETGDNDMIAGTGTVTRIESTAPGRRRWHFDAPQTRDVAFALAPFLRAVEAETDGVTVRSWYLAQDRLRGAANLRTAESTVGFFTEAFGDLPFDEVEVVATRGLLGGMEYPGLVFVSDTGSVLRDLPLVPDLLRYAGFEDEARRYVLAHEVAHQWWYASVGSDQVREPWLDEAMAEMSTILWLRSTDDDDRAWRMTNMIANASPESAEIAAGVSDFGSNRTYSDVIYQSGGALLMQLREQVGATTFLEIVRTYYDRYRLGSASIDDFIDTVRSVGGREAADLLERHR